MKVHYQVFAELLYGSVIVGKVALMHHIPQCGVTGASWATVQNCPQAQIDQNMIIKKRIVEGKPSKSALGHISAKK